MIPLYLVSLPRCGTNLLAATLHAHPAIWSLAHRETRRFQESDWRGLDDQMAHPERLPHLECIYPRARPAKDVDAVRYVLFDKVDPGKARPDGKTLVLLRDEERRIASLDRFARKYDRPIWRNTPENRMQFEKEYSALCDEALDRHRHTRSIWLEGLVKYPKKNLRSVFCWLNIPFSPCDFGGLSACCNAPFVVRDTTAAAGAFWQRKGITLPPRPHYHCSVCGEPVIGYGGYNPYEKLDVERVMRGTK